MKPSDADMQQAEDLMNRACTRMELVKHVAKAIHAARAAERKRCVKVCERVEADELPMHRSAVRRVALLIRRPSKLLP